VYFLQTKTTDNFVWTINHSSQGIRRGKFEEEGLYFEFSKAYNLSNPVDTIVPVHSLTLCHIVSMSPYRLFPAQSKTRIRVRQLKWVDWRCFQIKCTKFEFGQSFLGDIFERSFLSLSIKITSLIKFDDFCCTYLICTEALRHESPIPINRQSTIDARASSATFAWLYTTVVAVLTYLSSILSCPKAKKHASDHIVMDSTPLPPYSSL